MPIAAVPKYLGTDFSSASPGLRFGLYLSIWTSRQDQEQEIKSRADGRSREAQELSEYLNRQGMDATIDAWTARDRRPLPGLWEKNTSGAKNAWKSVVKLNVGDQKAMKALSERQLALAQPFVDSGQLVRFDTHAVAPFTTGLGNEHPLENGFAFLNPYGLPYLPGSGVKGVLRQAARELAEGTWGDPKGWNAEAIDVLFGKAAADGVDHQRGALTFWDVMPQVKGNALQVEVMTPHQTHYYQNGESPHESGSPNPINFLTVPPGSGFTFHVHCNRPFLRRLDPALDTESQWQRLLSAAFEHAFAWLGFGAKTAVGYGAMGVPGDAPSGPNGAAVNAGNGASAPQTVVWDNVKLTWNPGPQELKAVGSKGATAPVKGKDAAKALFAIAESFDRLLARKELKSQRVEVEVQGNMTTLKKVLPAS